VLQAGRTGNRKGQVVWDFSLCCGCESSTTCPCVYCGSDSRRIYVCVVIVTRVRLICVKIMVLTRVGFVCVLWLLSRCFMQEERVMQRQRSCAVN
jgi:hypothetical protein